MGSAWSNPGPAKQVIITGDNGELLVYDGVPAAGNLILAISGQPGSDSFGNSWEAGLNLAGQAIITGQELVYSAAPALGNLLLAISGAAGSDSFGNKWESGVTIEDTSGGLLVYNGEEALDNLIVAVAAAAGTDQEGNKWKPGLNILAPTGQPSAAIYFRQFGGDPTTQNAVIEFDALPGISHTMSIINEAAGSPSEETFIVIEAQNSAGNIPNGSAIVLDSENGVGFGSNGFVGGTLFRQATYSKSGVPSQVNPRSFVTSLTTVKVASDYGAGAGFSVGVFAAPTGGVYHFDHIANGTSSAMDCDIEYSSDGGVTWTVVSQDSPPASRATCHCSIDYYMNPNDLMRFGVSQTSGGAITITGTVIGRRVVC